MECVQISLFDKIGTCIDFGVLFCTSLYYMPFTISCLNVKMNNENNKLPTISRIHKSKYEFKADQQGTLKR